MAGTFLGFPFDEELFYLRWKAAVDPVLTAMLSSGAVARDREIEKLISNGSNLYTIPHYNVIGGEPENYDGSTDVTITAPDGGSQSGVVYGRAHAWKDQDFVRDFGNNINPMEQITSQVAHYWNKRRQKILIGILDGLFGIATGGTDLQAEWGTHTVNIAVTDSTTVVDETNLMGAATLHEASVQACGDHSDAFTLAIMHSKVALTLDKLQLLEFRKYTDPMGIERRLPIADGNGFTIIVDDGVTHETNTTSTKVEYTTYLLGSGVVRYAPAPVDTPVEVMRQPLEAGGYNALVTRMRETFHPAGFTYTLPSNCLSPTDAQLKAHANWKFAGIPLKTIPIARIITNG